MMQIIIILFCVSTINLPTNKAAKLPAYIKPCSRHETNMNACALKSARAAIPRFIHGDRKYRIPDLDPLKVIKLRVNEGVLGLNLTMTDVNFVGLSKAYLEDIEVDIHRRYTRYGIKIPRAEINNHYEIQGRILVLPITGSGPGNITLMDLNLNYTYEWDLVQKKDGLNYVMPKNSNLVFTTSRLYVKLDNLFNGNKLLGDQMHIFMDENWKELVKDIGPIVGEAISETMRRILANIFELVSYEQAFPDVPAAV